jgi:hypothetical protein
MVLTFLIVLGLSDNIRGTALGTADRATSSATGVQKNTDLSAKGRAEFEEGIARLRGHAPAPQVAPAESTPSRTAPIGTEPADRGTAGTGTGTGAGTGAAVGGASGVTDQGRQQVTGDEHTSTAGGKSGPESTGLCLQCYFPGQKGDFSIKVRFLLR